MSTTLSTKIEVAKVVPSSQSVIQSAPKAIQHPRVTRLKKESRSSRFNRRGGDKDKSVSTTPRNALRDLQRTIKYSHFEPQMANSIYCRSNRGMASIIHTNNVNDDINVSFRQAILGKIEPHSLNSFLPENVSHLRFTPHKFTPQVGVTVNIDSDALEALDDISNALKNLSVTLKLDDATHALINDSMKTLETMKNTTHRVDLEFGLSGILQKLKDSLPEIVLLFLIVAIILSYASGRISNNVLVGMIIGYFSASVVSFSSILDSVMTWFNETFDDTFKPQSGSTSEVITMVVGIINTYMCFATGANVCDLKHLTTLIGALSRTENGVRPVIDMIYTLLAYANYAVMKYIYNDKEAFIHTGKEIIDDYLKEYESIRYAFEDKTLFNNDYSLDRVRKCISKGESLIIQLPATRDILPFRMRVSDTLIHLGKYKSALLATNFKFNGQRQEPVSVLFRGAPGVGKSLAMQHFAHVVARDTFNDEDYKLYSGQPGLFIYNRQAECVFWDGYDSMKRILFVDDMLQARDVAGNPDNEIMNMIRAINIFENQLHCAAMELKGNTTFRSAFVFANTNARSYNFESICEPGAFLRRWDIVVDVYPSEDYALDLSCAPWDRKIDFSKLPIVDGETMMHPEQLSFAMCKLASARISADSFNNSKPTLGFELTGEVLNFEQLGKLVIARYNTKKIRHLNCLKALEKTLMRPQVIGDQPPKLYFRDDVKEYMMGDAFAEMYWLDELESDPDIAAFIGDLRVNHPKVYEMFAEYVDITVPIVLKNYILNLQDLVLYFKDQLTFRYCSKPSWVLRDEYLLKQSEHFELIKAETKVHAFVSNVLISRDKCAEIAFSSLSSVKRTIIKTLRTFIISFVGLFTGDTWNKYIDFIDTTLGLKIPFHMRAAMGSGFTYASNVVGMYTALFGVISFCSWLFAPKKKVKGQKVVPQSGEKDKNNRPKIIRTPNIIAPHSGEKSNNVNRSKIVRTPNVSVLKPQGLQSNSQTRAFIHSVTKRNVYEMWVPDGVVDEDNSRMVRYGTVIALGGRTVIFPYHYISEMAHSKEIGIIKGHECIEFKKVESDNDNYLITVDEFLSLWKNYPEYERMDQAVVLLPRSFPPARDISKYCVTDKKLAMFGVVDAALYIPYDSSDPEGRAEWRELITMRAQYMNQPIDVQYGEHINYQMKESFMYSAPTNAGDCGAVLYSDDPRGNCILGFHIAGVHKKRVGLSTILTAEAATKAREIVGDDYLFSEDMPCDYIVSEKPNTNITPELEVEKQFASHSSGRTKCVPSPLYGGWGPAKTRPAALRSFYDRVKDRVVDPMMKAVSGYCKGDVYIPYDVIDEAAHSLEDNLRRESKISVPKKNYTFEEAVLGDGTDFFKCLPRNTSAGFPYTSMPGLKSKERFFGDAEMPTIDSPEAEALHYKVDEIVLKARNGIRCRHVYTDFLKDERRKHAKVLDGNTRLVSGSPTPLLIATRMYFGAFMRWILMNSVDNGVSLGISEYSEDWDLLAKKLIAKGGPSSIGAGDYKNYDMSLRPRIMWAVLDIINRWYGDYEGNQVRKILFYEVVNSCHLNGNTIYTWSSSLPSGAFLTALVDSLCNQMNFRVIYIDIFGNCSTFNLNVYLTTGGDDHAYGASPAIHQTFTERAVQRSMAKIGMVYTPESKDKDVCDDSLRNISQITYLKRRFVFDASMRRYVAPLDIEVILEMPYWVKDGAATSFDCENNLRVAFEELSLHEKVTFDEWSIKILNFVSKTHIRPPVNTYYHTLRKSVLDRDGSISTKALKLVPHIYRADRLHMPSNEFHSGKEGRVLLVRRPCVIKRYCQGGVQAAPAIPRSYGLEDDLVRSLPCTFTANTNTNQDSVNESDSFPLTQQPGSVFVHSRTAADGSSFVPSSTANATNDAEAPSTSIAKYIPLDLKHLESADTGVSQDVSDFLAKPYLLQVGAFATTDVFSTFIFQQNSLFHSVIRSNVIWSNKLSGNLAVKGDMVFTLFVNGNRFQQGRYILAWVPDGGAGVNSANWIASHCANLTQVTQLPHVDIDINVDTQVTLTVPFINAMGWSPNYAGANNYGDIGSLILVTYSPLISPTGSTNAKWSLYVHLENVCYKAPFVPQSGRSVSVRGKRPADAEQKASGKGPISSFLSKVSTAGQILSGVPILSSVAGPVSWAADIGASVASVFGWSKPSNMEAYSMISRYIFPKYNNSDTMDSSMRLAVMDTAAVEDLPGFAGSDVDEMALSYVQSIPAYYASNTWTTSQAEGADFGAISLDPHAFYSTSTYGASTVVFPTPLSFCSNFFSLYRGSIKFTFKIVKTEFHSGRLAISFLPQDYNAQGAGAIATLANSEYLHREIIDIRTGSEFTFVIPFVSLQPYRPVFGSDAPYGKLYIHVLNPLVAPSSVSSSVRIIIEVSAGPDFELAYPRGIIETPVAPFTPQVGRNNIAEIVSTEIGNSNVSTTLTPAKLCIGERVLSFRQLIKRFNPLILNTTGAVNTVFQFYPYSLFTTFITGANVYDSPENSADILSNISFCYALSRGSIRYKFLDTKSNDFEQMNCRNVPLYLGSTSIAASNFSYQASPPTTLGGFGNGENTTLTYTAITGGIEAEFPFYSRTFAYPTADVYNNKATDFAYNVSTLAPRVQGLLTWSANPTGINVFRAAGEDFSLGLFVSTPGYINYSGAVA